MINFIICFFIILLSFNSALTRNIGETEITTDDGIEVFQEEKYYLLKKNVEILSDEFNLNGQIVKVYFEKDLYDIKKLIAKNSVNFISELYNIKGSGTNLEFNFKKEEILVYGNDSKLFLEKTEMSSDGKILVNNIDGSFYIHGNNSKLISDDIFIKGSKIDGEFSIINEKRDIANLVVEDDTQLNIKTDDIIMFSKKAIYDKESSIIELFEDVKINRGNEVITGDYGRLDTKNNSYKVSSNEKTKVKAIIMNSDE